MSLLLRLLAVAILSVSLSAGSAAAQGVSVLNPIARTYVALGFVFAAPQGPGWREVGSAPDAFRLVYAEQVGEQINTRADFAAQAFDIPEPDKVPDALTLTSMSMAQRVEEKGDTLVATAQVQPVTGQLALHEYTIVFKMADKDTFEHHFVALSPDKKQYLAAKLITQEHDFRTAPYFAPLSQAMATLAFPGAGTAPAPAAGAPAEPAGTPEPTADAPAVTTPPSASAPQGDSTAND